MVPGKVFALVFGPEFHNVNIVVLALAVGILALSVSIILSSFFSGMGKHYVNAIGSGIGLVFTLGAGLLLIPRYGYVGAGLTASIAYLAATVQQVYMFFRVAKPTVSDFFIRKEDIDYIRNRFFRGKSKNLLNVTHFP
jgi:O-antigen/teichoic acid export membrane protein